ncbi:PHB depolymerase family esterase [Ideonella sp. A 288]|uniref:extracellular catalytic domain type 1 short-chain-length polyhydroxyalkanoate depolymerase n=1 Tax=Ideonella sp. A 288 TaxID=1962181 RepID=UPI000B4BFF22|nr:PHB depolymerase family esterase [Ideonella sp. A 288]
MKPSMAPGTPLGRPASRRKDRPAAMRTGRGGARGGDLSPGSRSLDGVYTDDIGSLSYKLFLSSALREHPPLFVMLHGASQTASDFAAGTRMAEVVEDCGGIALFPEQSRSAHPLGSWNWYDARHQLAEGGEPSLIVGLTRKIAADHGVDRRRIYVAGMSAGGAMAVILGQAFPAVYAAVGVHSGIPTGSAHDLMSALRTMNSGPSAARPGQPELSHLIPTIVFHGDNDRTVHPLNAVAVLAQAQRRNGVTAPTVDILSTGPTPMSGGREVTLTTHRRHQRPSHAELWIVHHSGHAWTGGSAKGSYTDESGPDASREMLRFFLTQSLTRGRRDDRA